MWQIGARREAGLKDGYGVCGNPLCCGSWLKDFPSISMRYAKDQDIVQPPSKLTGPCGKLRCCLRYEHETYLELADGVATRGCTGCSSDGKCGVVIDRNLLRGELTIKTRRARWRRFRPGTSSRGRGGQRGDRPTRRVRRPGLNPSRPRNRRNRR
jgi:cell fate regulator YaaT (PSP1 superfamily)